MSDNKFVQSAYLRLFTSILFFTTDIETFQPTISYQAKNVRKLSVPSSIYQRIRQSSVNSLQGSSIILFSDRFNNIGEEKSDENSFTNFFNIEQKKDISSNDEEENKQKPIVPIVASVAVAGAVALLSQNPEFVKSINLFFSDPSTFLQSYVDYIASMGDKGLIYFAAIYTVAEIFAIPAIPLTASAGYLFGLRDGTAVVLLSGTIAAAVGFLIARTLLREKVENILQDFPKFQAVDKVIGKEGLKLMILLRIAPIFPFSLSNYFYGVTKIEFFDFFIGTLIGFAPGTFAYVYTGTVGKALSIPGAESEPWYVYAAVLAGITGVLKVVADVATGVIEEIEEQNESSEKIM